MTAQISNEERINEISAFAKSIPMCSPSIKSETYLQIGYRGKRNDGIFVNLESGTVRFQGGGTGPIAENIANKFNLKLVL